MRFPRLRNDGEKRRPEDSIRHYLLPPGSILSITLIGFLLLGAVLYYRAGRIQRFLEPALAISQPRVSFFSGFMGIFVKEFGEEPIPDVVFHGDSIRVRSSLVVEALHHKGRTDVLEKLGRVFLETLRDPHLNSYVDVILVGTKAPIAPESGLNSRIRKDFNDLAGNVLDALYREVPELEKEYAMNFASSALSVSTKGDDLNWVEFYIIPSERIHVELLRKLEKYVR